MLESSVLSFVRARWTQALSTAEYHHHRIPSLSLFLALTLTLTLLRLSRHLDVTHLHQMLLTLVFDHGKHPLLHGITPDIRASPLSTLDEDPFLHTATAVRSVLGVAHVAVVVMLA